MPADQTTPLTPLPLAACKFRPARDAQGRIIGVEVHGLVFNDEIGRMPEHFAESARQAIAEANR